MMAMSAASVSSGNIHDVVVTPDGAPNDPFLEPPPPPIRFQVHESHVPRVHGRLVHCASEP